MWRDFFTKGVIVGLDSNAVEVRDESGRIRLYQFLISTERLSSSALAPLGSLEVRKGACPRLFSSNDVQHFRLAHRGSSIIFQANPWD